MPLHIKSFILFSLISYSCFSQVENITFSCSYYGETINSTIYLKDGSEKAKNVNIQIINVVGLKPNFEVKMANVPNAAAAIINSKRYILYNPEFMAAINNATNTDWAAISILAHEIGHHLNGHTLLTGGSRPETEVEADEFSGFILRKMGASLEEAQAAMAILSEEEISTTHPARTQRLGAISTGWKNADRQMGGNISPSIAKANKSAKHDASQLNIQENPTPSSASSHKNILGEISFTTMPQSKFYVTNQMEIVKVEKERLKTVGRIRKSNKPQYPFILYDNYKNLLYVNQEGEIVSEKGLKVGYIKLAT